MRTNLIDIRVPSLLRNRLHLTHRPGIRGAAVPVVDHLRADRCKFDRIAEHEAILPRGGGEAHVLPHIRLGNRVVGILKHRCVVGIKPEWSELVRHGRCKNGVFR